MNNNSILDKIISSKKVSDLERFQPSEVVSSLLKPLLSREADVIRRRFGLSEKDQETLENIGHSYQVTRERVRQIENTAIEKIKKFKNFREIIAPIENPTASILEQHGGIMSEESLLRNLLSIVGDTPFNRRSVIFILSELLSEKFKYIKEDKYFRPAWKVKLAPFNLMKETIDLLIKIVAVFNKPLKQSALLDLFKKEKFYENNKNLLNDETIISYLEIGQSIAKNPFDEYGLKEWGSISPKRMNDKIYLILKKHGKPLHFVEIAKKINEANFDDRKAHPPTVHNELILNKQYVLVGRGIYALREWGYEPGVVSDVLEDIMKKAEKPLSRDELVKMVLEKRIVKKNTIHLALTNKNKFQKVGNGLYILKKNGIVQSQ